MKLLYLYSNQWQRSNYEMLSNSNVQLLALRISGFYKVKSSSNNILPKNNENKEYKIERTNNFFTPFSLLDGIFNYESIIKQLNDVLKKTNPDIVVIDNHDRYVERILIKILNEKTKIIVFQHGFDPSEKLINDQKKIKYKISLFLRNLIFSKKISLNQFSLLNKRESKFVLYSKYFKNSYNQTFRNLNIIICKDPRLNLLLNKKKFKIKDNILTVFTGIFRYEGYEKKMKILFQFLEFSNYNKIYIKPKKGESEIIKKFISKNNFKKNYLILDFNLKLSEIINRNGSLMCSIESTLTLEFRTIGINSFLVYDFIFYKDSLIRRFNLNFSSPLKDFDEILKIELKKKYIDKLNYYFGFNAKELNFNLIKNNQL